MELSPKYTGIRERGKVGEVWVGISEEVPVVGPGSCADIRTKRSLENEGPGAGLGLARGRNSQEACVAGRMSEGERVERGGGRACWAWGGWGGLGL